MPENPDARELMKGGRIFLIHEGKLILHWNSFKPKIGRIIERSVGDLGHNGRWFDNVPQHLVISTLIQQADPSKFVCERSEVVQAVKDFLQIYIDEIDIHIPPRDRDLVLRLAQKYMKELEDELEYCKRGIMYNRKISFEYVRNSLEYEIIYDDEQ